MQVFYVTTVVGVWAEDAAGAEHSLKTQLAGSYRDCASVEIVGVKDARLMQAQAHRGVGVNSTSVGKKRTPGVFER